MVGRLGIVGLPVLVLGAEPAQRCEPALVAVIE